MLGILRQKISEQRLPSVGLHLIATNHYIHFLPDIVETAQRHFFPTLKRHIIIYTNQDMLPISFNHYSSIIFHVSRIPHEQWPYVTLKRFHYFSLFTEQLNYSFYCDVDSMFINTISADILGNNLLGTLHPGYVFTNSDGSLIAERGTVCSNPNSTACIPVGENQMYFCGGFFGGPHSKFMKLTDVLKQRIQTDIDNDVMADWHDESHLNWYFWKNPPIVLWYPFAVQEEKARYKDTRIIFLDKSRRGGANTFRASTLTRLSITAEGIKRRYQ